MSYRLQFKAGEWFVGAEDLHNTTWTEDAAQASSYSTKGEAEWMQLAMARTQGIQLFVREVA